MQPINSIHECNAAAQAIGNSDTTATQVNGSPLPEGCYDNGRLWLAIDPENQGNGADGGLRPICKTTGLLHTCSISTVKLTQFYLGKLLYL